MKREATAVILAGGQGTRIRELYPNTPKPMVPVAGQPFIEWVIRYLAGQGLRKFVISLGCMAQVAEDYFKNRPPNGLSIHLVRETTPLGTGGGLLLAQSAAGASKVLVVANADSLTLADLDGVWSVMARPEIDGVVLGVYVGDTHRYGTMGVSSDGLLTTFNEKQSDRGLINAGLYFFKRRILDCFPRKVPLSLEVEVIPGLLESGKQLAVYPSDAPFLDIGTPETVLQAENFIRRHFQQSARRQ